MYNEWSVVLRFQRAIKGSITVTRAAVDSTFILVTLFMHAYARTVHRFFSGIAHCIIYICIRHKMAVDTETLST